MPETAERRESLNRRRKRLRYRCWHRGTRELDLLLGSFADRHVDAFDDDQLDRFETLLEAPEPLIHAWLVAQMPPPPAYDTDVMRLLRAHRPDFPTG